MIQMIEHHFLSANKVAGLARSYHPLDSCQQLGRLLLSGTGKVGEAAISKPVLHKLISDILIKHHRGEATLKAKLVEKFIRANVVAAFEIRVNKSRADFLTINGDSKSFEIKSELDNLTKLAKQVSDYEKVFDFNYIVIDKSHYTKALEIIPERYGIMMLIKDKLVESRKGQRNDKHDIQRQLNLFSKKEFLMSFPVGNITKEEVLINYTDAEINDCFKRMLKNRYSKRWSFIVDNAEQINAIDYQFFFQHNLPPSIIYGD